LTLKINYSTDAVAVPLSILSCDAGRIELKLIILLASDKTMIEEFDERREEIANFLSVTHEELDRAIEFWIDEGVIISDNKEKAKKVSRRLTPRDTASVYSGSEISSLLENPDNALKNLIDECQNISGRLFNLS